jgi:glycosyltransferase involved in cell wall biosynthesis
VIRLAFCIDNFRIGGTELNAVRWAERLDPARFALSVIHFQADGPLRSRYERLGVRLVALPLRNLYGPGALAQGWRLARWLAAERIQVLHTHDIYSNIFAVPWARLAGVPAVVASRRWWQLSPRAVHRVANRWASRAAHRVVANSPSVATLLTREDGVAAAKVFCVPNCLAEDAFAPLPERERAAWRARLGLPAHAVAIGIVARLDPVKDHATLVRAFAQLCDAGEWPELHLVCVGDGPVRGPLATLVERMGIGGRVHLPGTLTPPFNVQQLFDISVLCSVTEGSPNAVLEAMAAARPVVATRVGGIPDAVRDGDTGLLVPAGAVDALAAALRGLLRAPARARALGARAQAYARAEHHEERVIPRLSDWYAALTTNGRS